MMKHMLAASGFRKTDDQLQQELLFVVGDGPMRFGPVRQAGTIRDELKLLSMDKVESFAQVKAEWEFSESKNVGKFTDHQILRFVQFTNYDVRKALSLMTRTNPRHFQLNAFDLQDQLLSKTLFPVPGLQTLQPYSDVFYMRPSRFFPKDTKTSDVINNLVYVMDHMTFKNENGVAFIANMNDWTMSNFSTEYCFKFMQVLQGRQFPAKVNLFLIVNPPSWFDKVWKIMKPMLSKGFRKKVHFTNEDELWTFLKVGYEEYLPDEFIDGKASTEQMVEDFVKYRKNLEAATIPGMSMKRLRNRIGDGNAKRKLRFSWPRRRASANRDTGMDPTETEFSERSMK